MHFDQPILLHKTSLMQKLSDYVRAGFTDYTSGVVTADRASAFVRKMVRYYRVDLGADRNVRARAKAAGEGCAILLMYECGLGTLTWFLLVSPGEHPAKKLEMLCSALDRDARVTLTGYELVRHTRSGASVPAWTWRMADQTYRDLRRRVIETVRRGDPLETRQLIRSLYAAPGFSLVRRQIGKCTALLRAEWRRARGKGRLPALLQVLPYVARLRCEGIGLSFWLKRDGNREGCHA